MPGRGVKSLQVLIQPFRVLLIRGEFGKTAADRVSRVPVLPDGMLRQADVHSQEWLGVPVQRLWRLARIRHHVRRPLQQAPGLPDVAQARVSLRRLESVVGELRRTRTGSGECRRRVAYGGTVAALQQRKIAAVARGR